MSHHWGYSGHNGECEAASSGPRAPGLGLGYSLAPSSLSAAGCLGPSRAPALGCPWRDSENYPGSDLKPAWRCAGARRDSATQHRGRTVPIRTTYAESHKGCYECFSSRSQKDYGGGGGDGGLLSPSLQSLPHLWLRLPAHFVKAFSGASLNLTELAPELSIHFSTCSVVDNWMSS